VVHHNLLGGNCILATVAHNSHILGLHQSLVVNLVSCCMGHGGRTGEDREIEATNVGNYTPVVEEIDFWVA
jgi:hypothetical protein